MKATAILILAVALETIPKELIKRLEDLEKRGQVETIIMSHRQHGSPWPSLATRLYHPLLPVGLQGYILYRHRAVVYRINLVVLPLFVHVNGVHRSMSLMSSSPLLQQCPAYLVCLTWIIFVMGCRWSYSWCFFGCNLLDLFNIPRSILV